MRAVFQTGNSVPVTFTARLMGSRGATFYVSARIGNTQRSAGSGHGEWRVHRAVAISEVAGTGKYWRIAGGGIVLAMGSGWAMDRERRTT